MRTLIQIAGVALTLALTSPMPAVMQKTDDAASILQRIESSARDIRQQSDRLMAYGREPGMYDWQLHASELSRIKAEVNDISGLMTNFENIESRATLQQKYAFNQVVADMAKVSDATRDAIKELNSDEERVEFAEPKYFSKVTDIYDASGKTVSVLEAAHTWEQLPESWKTLSANGKTSKTAG
jgi:hypothetical protein